MPKEPRDPLNYGHGFLVNCTLNYQQLSAGHCTIEYIEQFYIPD